MRARQFPTSILNAMSRSIPVVLVCALLLSACQDHTVTDRYGFLALLGQDTLSVESVTRYRDRIVSEEVDRFPEVRRRHTEITLNPDGSPRRMDMQVHTPSAPAKTQQRRIVADFGKNQVKITLTDGDGTHVKTQATDGLLTLPHVPQMYSLYELYFSSAMRRAAAESLPAGKTIDTHQFYPDREFSNYPNPMHHGHVRFGANGTATIQHDWLAGLGQATVDSAGRLLSYDGDRTTYKVKVTRLSQQPDVEAIGVRFTDVELTRGKPSALSVRDTLRATIGSDSFMVDYGRPLARGRTLVGEVIPYDQVWRTGANAATQFSTSAPITIGSIALAPGMYTLWTLPRRDGVMLIVNGQTGQWGTGYGPAHDIGRTPMTATTSATPVEKFTIAIEPTGARSGLLVLSWGTFRWEAPITVGGNGR